MSMLAERKRKQKWSLNPRGKDWSEDSNKFGQKILEKMGWSRGKGLGVNENGITEHVKIAYKNDSKGMGYKENNDQWTEHEANFSSLLEALKTQTDIKIENNSAQPSSLEKKSQKSRARVHYHKFTRGKDLSRYSEKDLAMIFGKKSLKPAAKTNDVSEESKSNNANFTYNGGSMLDYFKKKLPNFGKSNGYVVGKNGVLKANETESEEDARMGFGFNSDKVKTDETEGNSSFTEFYGFGLKNKSIVEDHSVEGEEKISLESFLKEEYIEESSKPNKSKKSSFVSYIKEEPTEEEENNKKRKAVEEIEDILLSPKKKGKIKGSDQTTDVYEEKMQKKKKKNKKSNKINGNDIGISNPAFDPQSTNITVEKHILNTIEEDYAEEKGDSFVYSEGKNSFSRQKIDGRLERQFSEISTISNDSADIEGSKKKSKLKKSNALEIDNSPIVILEEDSSQVNNSGKKKKNKSNGRENTVFNEVEEINHVVQAKVKNKNKKIKEGLENPIFNAVEEEIQNSSCQQEYNSFEVKTKNKKKKKNKEKGVENPNFYSLEEKSLEKYTVIENPFEVKPKSKKKKSKDNSAPDEASDHKVKKYDDTLSEQSVTYTSTEDFEIIEEDNPYEIKLKNKKKKKEAKTEELLAIDNPTFNLNDPQKPEPTINERFEIKRKKKKSKKIEEGLDNVALNLDDSESSQAEKENVSLSTSAEPEINLMLNVVATPVIQNKSNKSLNSTFTISKPAIPVKRRKSVRFSDVTEERIIPNNYQLQQMEEMENRNELFDINNAVLTESLENEQKSIKRKRGLCNEGFEEFSRENLETLRDTLDTFQAEIENDINEAKVKPVQVIEDVMVGDVGNFEGENEKLPDGTKLKFKNANFGRAASYLEYDSSTGARKGYKHLIKGDIVLGFKNTNLHEIEGYATKNR